MNSRFSQLFVELSSRHDTSTYSDNSDAFSTLSKISSITSDSTLATTTDEFTKKKRKHRSISKLFLQLFSHRNGKSQSKPLTTKFPSLSTPNLSSSKPEKRSNWKEKIATPGIVIHKPISLHHATIATSTESLPTSIKTRPSLRDSMFSSLSSLGSYKTNATTISLGPSTAPSSLSLLSIPRSELAQLQSKIRRLGRALNKQEYLTSCFSANLAYLMARKERSIEGNRRIGDGNRRELIFLFNGLRNLVGKTFLRKAVFLQRSQVLVGEIGGQVARAELISTERSRCSTDSESTCVSEEIVELRLDVEGLLGSLQMLNEDLDVQASLDGALRGGIVGPCEDTRLPSSENERIAMGRFVVFVDGRLGRLRECYGATKGMVEGLAMRIANMKIEDAVG